MLSIRKRGAVYGVIGLMLCVAVYLNWSYFQSPSELTVAAQTEKQTAQTSESVYGEVTSVNSDTSTAAGTSGTESSAKQETKATTATQKDAAPQTTASSDDSFSKARLKRQTARDEALSLLKETLADEKTSETAREEATGQISMIAANSVKESKIENELQEKGFSDAVVMITEDTISACVAGKSGALSETDVAKIADVIVNETGADLSMLRISDATSGS